MQAHCHACGAALSAGDTYCPRCGAVSPLAPTTPAHAVPGATVAGPPLEAILRDALAPKYQVLRALGAGGMGDVFLAREPALKRNVAVKVLAPRLAADAAARMRFEREAQVVASLSHPNIVPVHGVGELPDGTPYFVMQFVDGPSLAARIEEEGPLTVAETRRILGELAAALGAAHAKGIVHRDIKPANILTDRESGRVLVSDFGVAAITPRPGDGDAPVNLTGTGMTVGTPQYMSPEQLLSDPVDEKTDVYALGLLAYEVLTGAGPFAGVTPHELIAAHLRDTPRRLGEVRENVGRDLESLVAQCLEKDPARRPGIAEIERRLGSATAVVLEWPPPGLEDLAGGLVQVARRFWASAGLLLAGVIPFALAGANFSPIGESVGTTLLLITCMLALATLMVAAWVTVRVRAEAIRAVRAGYGWFTVLETMADAGSDTGMLIAGTGRFSGLTPEVRNRMRKARVWRVTLSLIGSATAGWTLFAIVWLAPALRITSPLVVWLALLPPALALIAHERLRALERHAEPPRARRRSARGRPDVGQLSQAWYRGFESVRGGQTIGRGPTGRARRVLVATEVLLSVAFGTAAVMVPLTVVSTVSNGLSLRFTPRLTPNLRLRLRFADAARPYGIAKDSSISPFQAGLAFATLNRGGESDLFPEQTVPTLPEPPWHQPLPAGLFPTARRSAFNGPDERNILEAARRGFSPAEMAYLDRVAHDPVWPYFSRVARAPAVDFLGGRFKLPFPDSAPSWAMPWVAGLAATRELAYAAASRAAWFYARRQLDSAEVTLREVVSFGLALKDEGPFSTSTIVGMHVVGTGESNLQRLYELTANPLARRIRAMQDSAVRAADIMGDEIEHIANPRQPLSANDVRRQVVAWATDSLTPRGLRITMLTDLVVAQCGDLRELVFGPAADVREAFASARRNLARYAADTALLGIMYQTPARARVLRETDPDAPMAGFLLTVSRALGVVLHNPRIPGCARLASLLPS